MSLNRKKLKWGVIITMLGAILLVHYLTYFTQGNIRYEHSVHRMLFYLPLVLASVWFGLNGALSVSAAVIVCNLPYAAISWQGLTPQDFDILLQAMLLVIVGTLLGFLVERERTKHKALIQSESLAAVGRAVSEIAHDMRTPLMSIGGFTSQVLRCLSPDDLMYRKLQIAVRQTARLEAMVRELLELEGNYYLIRGEEYETRFGLEGEPKFWVKKVIDLGDGSSKIIKLVFHESVYMSIGEHRFQCFRSPQKEGRILEKINGDAHFMQGITAVDCAGNTIRILDRIRGKCFYNHLYETALEHEMYFVKHLPGILRNIIIATKAIARLHEAGEVHGDIRTDHIFIERGTSTYRWIDFDYTYDWSENPFGLDLFGLGNILVFAVGKGFYPVQELRKLNSPYSAVLPSLRDEDFSLYSRNRIMNLRKLFPYIPESLNLILMHFAQSAEVFYENTEEFLEISIEPCAISLALNRTYPSGTI